MGISEKRSNEITSYTATALSILLAGWLGYKGLREPRTYTASMYYNDHGEYTSCRECHSAPDSPVSFGSMMTCITSKCHSYLDGETTLEEAILIVGSQYYKAPNYEEEVERTMAIHEMTGNTECIECHKEHEKMDAPFPEGWDEKEWQESRENRSMMSSVLSSNSEILEVHSAVESELLAGWVESPSDF